MCTKYDHSNYFKPFPTSVSRRDYKLPCDAEPPDRVTPRRIQMRHQRGALPTEHYFRHHGKAYDCNKITQYDEVYNGRRMTDKGGSQRFPEVRRWSMVNDAWKPEHSDYPLQGLSSSAESSVFYFTRNHVPVRHRNGKCFSRQKKFHNSQRTSQTVVTTSAPVPVFLKKLLITK